MVLWPVGKLVILLLQKQVKIGGIKIGESGDFIVGQNKHVHRTN